MNGDTIIATLTSEDPLPNTIDFGDLEIEWKIEQKIGNALLRHQLEYGFAGPDRIGRVYNDPPRPHVGPAFDEWAPKYVQALADLPSLGG